MLHHVALGARDVSRVAAFYRDVFGLPEVRRFHAGEQLRSIWLGLGAGSVLMIERVSGTLPTPPTSPDEIELGPSLLAFQGAASARREQEAKLIGWGSVIERRTEHTSYARDPEGNRVALSDYPLPEPSP